MDERDPAFERKGTCDKDTYLYTASQVRYNCHFHHGNKGCNSKEVPGDLCSVIVEIEKKYTC